ncbi:hypothetical protein ACFVL4_15305 [Bacillus subtilis]
MIVELKTKVKLNGIVVERCRLNGTYRVSAADGEVPLCVLGEFENKKEAFTFALEKFKGNSDFQELNIFAYDKYGSPRTYRLHSRLKEHLEQLQENIDRLE